MKRRFFKVIVVYNYATIISNVYTDKDVETFVGIIKAFAISQGAVEFSVKEINVVSDDILFNAMSKAL